MEAIDTLMREHRQIETGLEGLEGFARALVAGATSSREDLGRFVHFIRAFADRGHHGKEEDILFRAMIDHGMPVQGGPLAVMLAEHDEGRRLVGILAEVAGGEGEISAAERPQVMAAVEGFTSLLREHIQKEDQILYPMAMNLLPAEVFQQMRDRFEEFDLKEVGREEAARLVALAQDLHARYA